MEMVCNTWTSFQVNHDDSRIATAVTTLIEDNVLVLGFNNGDLQTYSIKDLDASKYQTLIRYEKASYNILCTLGFIYFDTMLNGLCKVPEKTVPI